MNIIHFLHLRKTKYIRLSPHKCQGCWECVEICPESVLVKMDRRRHAHVHIEDPDACTGCKKCVWVCEHHAIEYIYVPKFSQSTRQLLKGEEIHASIKAPIQ